MSSTRQLAAIMFTDIVGYTALMGKDEKKAFELLHKNREIHKPLIKQYHGTWIKELGDGVLASFHTVTDAVFCAAAIHQSCNNVEGLRLRIGIHLGEVIFENNDVFGDGVNIASRLQAMASIGTTWVSEAVYKTLVNKKEISSEFIKEETLKNVSEPVKVYEITVKEIPGFLPDNIKAYQKHSSQKRVKNRTIMLATGIFLAILVTCYILFFTNITKSATGKNSSKEKSIAVLYFDNMSGDPDQEYFSDGITEEIIAHISKISGIRVISRTSVQSYKGKPHNLKKIAAELNVSHILEGSMRKSGNTIRVSAQLIDAKTDQHIWAETFDRELKEIFEVQSDIARSIAQKFEVDITPETSAKINRKPTSNIEAYENFQKGYFFLYKKYFQTHQKEDFDKSKHFFEKAVQLDPGYAEAYAGLAELYDELRNYYVIKNNLKEFPDSLLRLKEQLARKALQLNSNSPYVNTAMAYALAHHPADPKFDSSYFYLKKALYLDPADALNNFNLGATLSDLGLNSLAVPFSLKAVKTDPLNPDYYSNLGYEYAMLGKNDDAKQTFHKCLELTNERFFKEIFALQWLIYLGEFAVVEKRLESRPEYKFQKSFLYACKGEPEKIDTAYRKSFFILLATNQKKILKDILIRLEGNIDKGIVGTIVNYDFLRTSFYFDIYRQDADFKRILEKAKKNHEANILKYGKIEIPK